MNGFTTKVITGGIGLATNVWDYKSKRDEGNGVAVSLAKMGIETYLWTNPYTMPIMAGITAGQVVGSAVTAVTEYGKTGGNLVARQVNDVYRGGRGHVGGNFIDTNNANTMRQRGLQAMEHSGYNVRSVLGSEARTFYSRYY